MNEKSILLPKKDTSLSQYPLTDYFMCECQKEVVKSAWHEFKPIIENLETQLASVPKIYGQEKLGMQALVYVHYFGGSTDIFITEYSDREGFGYVVLGGDFYNSELGYIPIEELTNVPSLNLDFYWTPIPLDVALHELNPSYFTQPKSAAKKIG